MQDRDYSALADSVRYCRAEDVVLGKGDSASVLHGTGIEIWNPELVVLLKWIWEVEGLLKVNKTLFGLRKDVLRIHVLRKGSAAENTKWDGLAI